MRKQYVAFFKRVFAGVLASALCISSFPSDGFQTVLAGTPAERGDTSLVYFVDCGDYNVTTVNEGEQFGTHNSVTDQAYGADPETGYEWGIVDGEELSGNNVKNPVPPGTGGVYTANTWAYEQLTEFHTDHAKTETNRYSKNFNEKGIDPRYVEYAFELEAGSYEVTVGCANPWGCSNSPKVTVAIGEDEVVLADPLSVPNKGTDEAMGTVDITDDTDSRLTVRVSGGGGANLAVNVAYITIRSVKAGETEDEKNVRKDKEVLILPESSKKNLKLPAAGENGSKITWKSLNQDIISADGVVIRPEGEAAVVTLIAEISCGEAKDTKEFKITVPAVAVPMPADRTDETIIYFVDCGDYVVNTVGDGDQFGTHNSVTDQAYDEDPETGYTWGIVDSEEELTGNGVMNGEAPNTGGVYTANTWAYEKFNESEFKTDHAKTETNRYSKNFKEKGYAERFVEYAFELEAGLYEVIVGCCNPWRCANSPVITAKAGEEKTVVLAEPLAVSPGGSAEAKGTVDVSDKDKKLTVRISGTGDGENDCVNVAYIRIRSTEDDEIVRKDKEALTLPEVVKQNFTLPAVGEYGSKITWESSEPSVISTAGEVNRPEGNDVIVTLKAEISSGNIKDTKEFKVTVPAVVVPKPAERPDKTIIYFVDCGDYVVSTVNDGEQLGTHNSVTDQAYEEDPETGYAWGIVDSKEELTGKGVVNGPAPDTGGVYTANTWAYEKFNESEFKTDHAKTETNRYSKNFKEKGYAERFVEYAFELEPGLYEVAVGCSNPWSCANSPRITAKVGEEEPIILADPLQVPKKGDAQASGTVKAGSTDKKLTVRVSGTGDGENDCVNVAYIIIRSTVEKEIVEKDKAALTLPESVTENLTLPASGANGSTITWKSSKPEVISESGRVTRPAGKDVFEEVTLTASISYGSALDTKVFTITVPGKRVPVAAVRPDSTIMYFVDCGDYVVNTVSDGDQLGTHNSVTDQVYGEDAETGYLWGISDTVSTPLKNGSHEKGGAFTDNTWPYESNTASQDVPKTASNRYTKNQAENHITERFLDYKFELENGRYDVTVCCVDPWGCSKTPTVYANYGKDSQITLRERLNASANEAVRKTVEVTDGELTINLRATGDDNAAINLAYILIATEMPPEKRVQADYEALNINTQISSDLRLVTEGENGSAITWSSSDESVITADGIVNRPAAGEVDADVTLTAVISYGTASRTKTFHVKVHARNDLEGLQDFALSDIELTDSYYVSVTEKDVAFLNKFDPDRLLYNFRLTAGYTADEIKDGRFDFNQDGVYAVKSYSGWEDSRIAGHTLGHYLAAAAQGVAAGYGTKTGEDGRSLSDRLDYLIAGLKDCQDKLGTGYIFGATMADPKDPERQFNLLEQGTTADTWVPWYTMHKIVNGLVETYKYTGSETALEVAESLGEWIYIRTGKWNSTIQARVLGVEYGGMNDCLYELYKCAKKAGYDRAEHFSMAAHWFDEDALFELVLAGTPNALNNRHANCTIPKFIGALNRYRALKDENVAGVDKYLKYAETFWELVVNDHTYITGGNSECEFFGADNILDAERSHCNNETCNTHNMLKLARELYRITGDKKYADYYETTFINAIMASVNEETGMTTYFQPMATGFFKVYCDPNLDSNYFWCCTGTGLENFTKLGDSFYFYSGDKLVVNEYTSSNVSWKEKGVILQQVSDIPNSDKTVFTVKLQEGTDSAAMDLRLRVPDWIAGNPAVKLNGEALAVTSSGGYISINRTFCDGDTIELTLPMELRAHTLPDNTGVYGFKYGPVVLAAELGRDDKMGTYQIGVQCEVCRTKIVNGQERTATNGYGSTSNQGTLSAETLNITEDISVAGFMADIGTYLVKADDSLTFTLKGTDWGGEKDLVFTPYYRIHDQRYGIYWLFSRSSAEELRQQLLKNKQAGRDANVYLEGVGIGYGAQTEGDAENYPHIEETGTGSVGDMGNLTRYAKAGGSFSYLFKVDKTKTNYITCEYSREDNGKTMIIKAGDVVIAKDTLNYSGGEAFYQKKYEIPAAAVAAATAYNETKDVLRISFEGPEGEQSPTLHQSAFTSTNYSTNAGITDIRSNIGTVTKTDDTSYRLEVPKNTQAVQVTTKIADAWGLLYINEELTDDTRAREFILTSDKMTAAIQVYAEDHETSAEYTLTIVRENSGGTTEPDADQEAADAVKNLINKIGTVVYTAECKARIDAARTAYDALSTAQKKLITADVLARLTDAETQYQKLAEAAEKEEQERVDQEAADAVKALIHAIGTVEFTADSKVKIDAARSAYTALSEAQKKLITADELKKLTDAETRYQALEAAAGEDERDKVAADAVKTLINAIGTVEYTADSKTKIDAARSAYTALSETQKKLITADILKKLTDAEARYEELKAAAGDDDQNRKDQEAADAVKVLIEAIGTVEYTEDSKAKIDEAKTAYEALSEAQKKLVAEEILAKLADAESKYEELKAAAEKAEQDRKDQEAADAVKELIDKIGTVAYTTDSKEKIDQARKAYEALSETQEKLISADTLKKLTDAEARYEALKAAADQEQKDKEEADQKAADAVKDLIGAIGTVEYTAESQSKIAAARKAYNALNADQKNLIAADILKKLTDAEDRYQELVDAADQEEKDKAEADQKAADTVKALIEAIGTVENTAESLARIEAARNAYNALSEDQKKLITADVLAILTGTESRYKELADAAAQKEKEKKEADQKAADEVKALVEAIGTVKNTAESQSKIAAARKAYDALSTDQKKLIAADILKKLTDAESRYQKLVEEADRTDKPNVKSYVNKTITVKGYKYKVLSQNNKKKTGTVSFTGVTGTKKKAKSITVPAGIKYKGFNFTVTAVGAKALKNNKKVTKLVIGKNVKTIGKDACNGCKKLKNITFKGTKVTSIGKGAFLKINSRPSVTMPKSVKKKYKKLLTKNVITKKAKLK